MTKKLILATIAFAALVIGGMSMMGAGKPVFDVTAFGATANDSTDDTTAIALAITAAAAESPADVVFPRGTYYVQDPTDVDGVATGTTAGCIRIPAGASNIRLIGQGAKIVLGANGTDTSVIRVFGAKCEVRDLEIDLNGTVPVATKPNIGIQINGSGGGTDNVDGCDNVVTGCYVHNSRRLTEYSTGTIEYDHVGHVSGSRALILSGGTWPASSEIIDGADATNLAAVLIAGTWYDVSSRASDSVLLLSASDNPGSDVAAGTAYTLNAEPYNDADEDGIQVLNGHRNRIEGNLVVDVGWTALRSNGNGNILSRNILSNFRGNGIRIADGDYCLIEGNWISSEHCSGRSCLLADAGSGADDATAGAELTNNDVRNKDLMIRDNYSYCNSNGNFEGAGSAMKVGAIRHCVVDGGVYYAGTETNNTAIRIEDCIRKVTFQNLRCVGPFQQTNNAMTAAVTATTSRAAGTYPGMLQLTIASHGQVLGKSVWLVNCPIAKWDDQEFIVIEVVDSNNIVVGRVTDDAGTVTPEPYAAGSITGTVAHASVHELVMRNVMVERGTHEENNFVRYVSSPWVDIEGCVFEQVGPRTTGTVKESGLLFDYASDAYIKRLRIVRNEFRFDTTALCRVIRSQLGNGTGASDEAAGGAATTFVTPGKFICYENRLENRSTGTVELVQRYEAGDSIASYDDRLIIFSTEGENPNRYTSSGKPTESWAVWTAGQTIRNYSPTSVGVAPGWIYTAGTWRSSDRAYGLYSNTSTATVSDGTEQTLQSYTMPAASVTGDSEQITIDAVFTFASDGDAKRIYLKFGGTTIYDSGSANHNAGAVMVHAVGICDSASTQRWMVQATSTAASGAIPASATYTTTSIATGSSVAIIGVGDGTNASDISQTMLAVSVKTAEGETH